MPAPPGLRALAFRIESEEFAVLSFEIPGDDGSSVPVDALSPSLRQIAELAAAGRLNAEIATLRSTSVRTVENQMAEVYRRLGVRSRRSLPALGLAGAQDPAGD